MRWWLIKNYFKLNKFMDIKFYPFTDYGLDWLVSYKISYNDLTDEQKKLSDEFVAILRKRELH